MSDHHVLEANHVRQVRFLSEKPLERDIAVLAINGDDWNRDLPSTDDTITIAQGSNVIRGTVTEIVFLVEVTP